MMITGKSATLFGPTFILVMGGLIWIVWSAVVVQSHARTHARIIKTRADEHLMADLFEERAIKDGGLTNFNRQFILDSIFTSNQNQIWFNTNASGELIDIWQTPYRIELEGPTNFVIHSAGKNQKFGDADDIVFNSASNDFVKP